MSNWQKIMNAAEIESFFAFTASVDRNYARAQREWYEGRTASQLKSQAYGAWLSNSDEEYMLCRSFAVLKDINQELAA